MTAILTDLYTMRECDDDGNPRRPLGEHSGASISAVLSQVGSLTLDYPIGAANAADAILGREVAVLRDGVEQPNCRFLLEESSEDLTDMNEDAAIIEISGRSFMCVLEYAEVYPQSWPSFNPPNQAFANATAGAVMSTLLLKAQQRGTTMRGLTWTFNSDHDSNGVAWTKQLDIAYDAGVNYLDILTNLVAQGLCEAETVGRELRLYEPSTQERHLESGPNAIIFRKGRDLKDTPNKKSIRDIGTVALIGGAENQYVEYVDGTAAAQYGRIERSFSQGGISDPTTLTTVAQSEIAQINQPKLERTHGLFFDAPGAPQPYRDYRLGDWVGSSVGRGTIDAYRIRQINLEINDEGLLVDGQVVLNDLFSEGLAALSRRIDGIQNGTTITGSSNATTDPSSDTNPPNPPTSVSFSSVADLDLNRAQITAIWVKPTLNVNGTAYDDHSHYDFRWRYTSSSDWPNGILTAQSETISFGPVEQNRAVEINVRAVDNDGNASAWAGYTGATAYDSTPPPVPSQPLITPDMGYLLVYWDQKGFAGQGMPADTRYVEVHASGANNFTPVAPGPGTTMVDQIAVGQYSTVISASYSAVTYVKFIAVDSHGNRSTASVQGSGTASQVVSSDIFDGAVGSAKLADAAIITAKIADLAVTDAKIQNLSVGKLTAGTMTAQVIIGNSIATATSGARVTMNTTGLHMYNSAGTEMVSILNTGNATFSGYLQATQILGTVSAVDTATGRRVDISPNSPYTSRPTITMSTGAAIEKSPALWSMGSDPFVRQIVTYIYGPGTGMITGNGQTQLTASIFQIETTPYDGDFANATELPTRVYGQFRFSFPAPGLDANGFLVTSPSILLMSELSYGGDGSVQGNQPGIVFSTRDSRTAAVCIVRDNTMPGTACLGAKLADGSAYTGIRASSYPGASASALKENITDVPWRALDIIRDNPARRWKFKNAEGYHIGPMADNLPDDIALHGDTPEDHFIDMGSAIGTVWQAVQEIVDMMEGKK